VAQDQFLNQTNIATGLLFPEGPVYLLDGSILVAEIAGGVLTKIYIDGSKENFSNLGGSPNGIAVGPDGFYYVCNSGGFEVFEFDGLTWVGGQPDNYSGGRIEKVDPISGDSIVLYSECNGEPLTGPNDIVFDSDGGFWFTDSGKSRAREMDKGGLYYAQIDGSSITEVIFPIITPNGVGLSPEGNALYFSETYAARIIKVNILAPGILEPMKSPLEPGEVIYSSPDEGLYDSLAIDSLGNICVATLIKGGISVISPEGILQDFIKTPDRLVTNICFGGADFKTAFITLSGTGCIISMPWKNSGLKLNFN
jgi:gluconolactonase